MPIPGDQFLVVFVRSGKVCARKYWNRNSQFHQIVADALQHQIVNQRCSNRTARAAEQLATLDRQDSVSDWDMVIDDQIGFRNCSSVESLTAGNGFAISAWPAE